MTSPELQKQMLRMLDGELPAEEAATLEAELKANPDARQQWWQLARIHSALESRFASEVAVQRIQMIPIKRVISMQRRRTVKMALTAAAAIFMVALLSLWMITASEIRPAIAAFQAAPDSIFTLTHSEKYRKKAGTHLRQGSQLTLTHGVAEVNLPHDVRALVQAPASLTLLDARTVRLDHGQAFFVVESASGKGFTVVTPHQRMVDLGTSFGLIVRSGDHRLVDLHVFDGHVRIDSSDGVPGEIITAGRAVELSGPDVTRELKASSTAFLHELPNKIETLFLDRFSIGLAADREYSVLIDSGVIRSETGEAFPGIHDNASWTFRTAAAASANLLVRNPNFEDDGMEKQSGQTIAHWQHGTNDGWGWGVDARRKGLAPTDGRFMGRVFKGRSLQQTTGETIRPGITYVLTLDVGLSNSAATVRLLDSDSDAVLAEANFHSSGESWLRNQCLVFTADTSHATGQKIGISLTCSDGDFAAFDRVRLGTAGHGAFDEIVVTEAVSSIEIPEVSLPRDANTPPQITHKFPHPGSTTASPGGPLVLQFERPIRFGRGRIRIRNLTDWTETTLSVGDPRLVIDGNTLTVHPPLELADGEIQMGRVPGWQSTGWTGLRRLAANGRNPRRTTTVATLDASVPSTAIRRAIGAIEPGRRYTASVSLRHRDASASPGYTIRLLSGGIVLAERTGEIAPANGEPFTLAWDAIERPAGVASGDPLIIEIAPARQTPGHLEIQEVRVTAVDGEAA
jgi:hypothetical protein